MYSFFPSHCTRDPVKVRRRVGDRLKGTSLMGGVHNKKKIPKINLCPVSDERVVNSIFGNQSSSRPRGLNRSKSLFCEFFFELGATSNPKPFHQSMPIFNKPGQIHDPE